MKKRFILLIAVIMGLSLFFCGCGPDIEELEVQAQEILEEQNNLLVKNLTLTHVKGKKYTGTAEIYNIDLFSDIGQWKNIDVNVTRNGRTIYVEYNF